MKKIRAKSWHIKRLRRSSLNRAVEATQSRLFRQQFGAETRKPATDMRPTPNQETPSLGCGHVATPGPRKRGPSRVSAAKLILLGERLLPQSSRDSPRWVFGYKYGFQQRKMERRLGLSFVFIFLGFRLSVS